MEEMIDFDEWILQQVAIPDGFCAVYDPETGMIKMICSLRSAVNEKFKVDITKEFAESIFSGTVNPGLFFVDPLSLEIKSLENDSLVKVNQLILRVPDKKFSDIIDADIYIAYDRSNKKLSFELSKKFGGTYWDNSEALTTQIVFWDNSVTVNFLLCKYNDPNIMHETISFTLSEMIGNSKIFNNIELPSRFSVYHYNQILKNYIVEEL